MPWLKQSSQRANLRKRIGFCVLVMAALTVLGVVWWEASLVTVVLLVFGLMCFASAFYIWLTSRRIDKLLDGRGTEDEAEKKSADGE